MMNTTLLLRRIQYGLGQRYQLQSQSYYLDIIEEQSLITFSYYYPKYKRGIRITKADAITSFNPTNRRYGQFKYKIPNFGEDIKYLDIDDFHHPYNDRSSSLSSTYPAGNMVAALAATRLLSTIPHNNSPYTVFFEAPDIVEVHPVPIHHVDFTIDMKCVRPISQIKPMYIDDFVKLCLLDIKIALYNHYINLRNSGTFGGVEINPYIDDFSSAESDRESLLEKFKQDSVRQYENMVSYFNKIVY